MIAILVSEKGGEERREEFERQELTIGRVRGNDVVLPKGNVSKRHARITCKDGRFVVVDLNSTNGTYVNRQRIAQATIVRAGDRIYIGDFVLRLLEPGRGSIVDANPDLESPEREAQDVLRPPVVPPPPRVPSTVSPDEVRPSGEPGGGSATLRIAALLVERVVARLDPGVLERDLSPSDYKRVERLLQREADALRPKVSGAADFVQGLQEARDELLGLGPLQRLVEEPDVQQVLVLGTERVQLWRVPGAHDDGRASPVSSAENLERLLGRLCRESSPTLDPGARSLCGRTRGVLWRATRVAGTVVLCGRRASPPRESLAELSAWGVFPELLGQFLEQCVRARLSLLVVGRGEIAGQVLGALGGVTSAQPLIHLQGTEVLVRSNAEEDWMALPSLDLGSSSVDLIRALRPAHVVVEQLDAATGSAVLRLSVGDGVGVIAACRAGSYAQALSQVAGLVALDRGLSDPAPVRHLLQGCFDLVLELDEDTEPPRLSRVLEVRWPSAGGPAAAEILRWREESPGVGAYQAPGGPPLLLSRLDKPHTGWEDLFRQAP